MTLPEKGVKVGRRITSPRRISSPKGPAESVGPITKDLLLPYPVAFRRCQSPTPHSSCPRLFPCKRSPRLSYAGLRTPDRPQTEPEAERTSRRTRSVGSQGSRPLRWLPQSLFGRQTTPFTPRACHPSARTDGSGSVEVEGTFGGRSLLGRTWTEGLNRPRVLLPLIG